jgi:hypothetical protein
MAYDGAIDTLTKGGIEIPGNGNRPSEIFYCGLSIS